MVWVAIAILGGVGALARFFLDGAISRRTAAGFPFGTLAINLSGAFLLGALVGLALSGDAALIVDTALLGAYTTFSTWMFETHRLGEDSQPWLLWLNLAVSIAAGIAAIAIGRAIGEAL
jgi:CrcB protein